MRPILRHLLQRLRRPRRRPDGTRVEIAALDRGIVTALDCFRGW